MRDRVSLMMSDRERKNYGAITSEGKGDQNMVDEWSMDQSCNQGFGVTRYQISTPAGGLLLVAYQGKLRELQFESRGENGVPLATKSKVESRFRFSERGYLDRHISGPGLGGERAIPSVDVEVLQQAERELLEYFAGERTRFDVPCEGLGTPFQKRVWERLCDVPYGATETYLQLATRLGKPEAVRAVGGALGKNPIAIIVPCHRIIGSGGKLVGFAGGLHWKQYLLELEKKSK